jgi:hypothetical protein
VFGILFLYGLELDRTCVTETRVESSTIIKHFDVVEDRGASFGSGGKAAVIDDFVFKAAPERLDEGVVVAVCAAAQGRNQSMSCENLTIGGAGKLSAAV